MLLLKKKIFNNISWENKLKISGEHPDFLLQIKNSKWDLVFTLNSIHLHREDIKENTNPVYVDLRKRKKEKIKVFREKWGVDSFISKIPLKVTSSAP